jgi:hypothetical protein
LNKEEYIGVIEVLIEWFQYNEKWIGYDLLSSYTNTKVSHLKIIMKELQTFGIVNYVSHSGGFGLSGFGYIFNNKYKGKGLAEIMEAII